MGILIKTFITLFTQYMIFKNATSFSFMLENYLADETNKDNKRQIDVEGKIVT